MKINQMMTSPSAAIGMTRAYQNTQKSRMADQNQQSQQNQEIRNIKQILAGTKREQSRSILESGKQYAEDLRKQRLQSKDSSLAVTKLKYNFKNLSSRILRSKTSTAARQAASQAQREVQRLKAARMSGKYDDDEIDAAISHAKAMERVAKKKARHLEEEELAKVASRRNAQAELVEEEKTDSEEVKNDSEEETEKEPERAQEDYESNQSAELQVSSEEFARAMAELSDEMSSSEEILSESFEDLEKMMDDMEELTEEGFEDLAEEVFADVEDMDSEDLKEMIVKHRNKEMKEMVHADADYLKATFQQLEKSIDITL